MMDHQKNPWVLLLGFLTWLRNGLEKVSLASHRHRVGKKEAEMLLQSLLPFQAYTRGSQELLLLAGDVMSP